MKQPAIFLDRDGTIIVDKVYLNDPNLIEFLPNAVLGLKTLQQQGYLLIVVTNQSGIARGLVQIENLDAIHKRMQELLAKEGVLIEAFYYSPHAADSDHPLRKPNPGMIHQATAERGIDPKKSWMIGDKMIDVEAGHRAKMKSILIASELPNNLDGYLPPDFVAKDLLSSAEYIVSI